MTTAAIPADERPDGGMTLIEHLVELRDRLVKCVLAVVIGAVIGFVLYDVIFDFLIGPYQTLCEGNREDSATNCRLLVTDPLEGLSVRLKIASYTGIAIAMPVLLWQLWRFVSPGLYKNERRYAIPFVMSALLLFALGAAIAYWTLPQAINFLQTIGGDNLATAYSPAKYFQLIVYMMLAFGVGFEFPVLLVFLELAGVLLPATLSKHRRYAIVGICVIVAVITPSGDPVSMLALAVPMVVFYEVSILIGRLVTRRRAKAEAAG